MAIALVTGQHAKAHSDVTVTSLSVSLPGAATPGNSVHVAVTPANHNPGASEVGDNQGNGTYAQDAVQNHAGGMAVALYSKQSVAASGTFTVTETYGASVIGDVYVAEFSGVAASLAKDVSNQSDPTPTGNPATWSGPASGALAQTGELVIAASNAGGNVGPSNIAITTAGYTEIDSEQNGVSFVVSIWGYQVVADTTSQTVAYSDGENSTALTTCPSVIVAYKPVAAAATFANVRAFQEPDAFQPRAFQRPDPTDAFITRLHRFFQENAFQRPDPTGVFQFQGFDDEGFQSDAEAFADLVWQPDAFQIDEPLGSAVAAYQVTGVGAIPSAEAFGTAKVIRLIGPTGVSSLTAFGTTKAMRLIGPTGVGSLEAFGVPDVVRWLGPGGIASLTAFGTTKAMRLLYPLGVASAQAFGVTRLLSPQWVTGVGAIASLEAFGTTKVIRLLGPGGIASAQAFGTPQITRLLGPTGIASLAAFGVPKVLRLIFPLGVGSTEAFGRPTIIGGIQGVSISGTGAIPTAEAFGVPTVRRILAPTGIASLNAFGVTKLLRIVANAGAISSGQAFGTAAAQRLLAVTGIGSAQAFGAPKAMRLLSAAGIGSAESFGTAKVIRLIFPAGIATVASIGTPTVGPFVPSPLIIGGSVNLTDVVLYSVGLADGFILSALVTDLLLENEPTAADGALYSVTVTDGLLRSEDSSDGI